MIFEENNIIESLGESLGYIFSYFLFTTILFFILVLLNKLPELGSYIHIMVVVILIAITGTMIKKFLK